MLEGTQLSTDGVLALMAKAGAALLLGAAAFPFRFYVELGFFRSFSVLDIVLVVAGLVLLLAVIRSDGKLFVGDHLVLTLLALPVLVAIASISWSDYPAVSVRYVTHSLEGLVAYLAVVGVMRNFSSRAVFRAMSGFLIALLVGSLLFYLQVPGFDRPVTIAELEPESNEYSEWMTGFYSRLGHPFLGQSNAFATVLIFFVPVFVAYARWADSGAARLVAMLCLVAVMLTLSRGAALALVLAMAVYALSAFRKVPRRSLRRWMPAAGAALVAMAGPVGFALSNPELAEVILESRLGDESFAVRLDTLQATVDKISSRPLLGYGAGVAGQLDVDIASGVHNTYIELVLSYGVPLGIAVSLCLLLLAYAVPRRRMARGIGPLAAGAAAAIVAVLGVFLTQASYESGPLRVVLCLSIGMTITLLRSAAREVRTVKNQEAARG